GSTPGPAHGRNRVLGAEEDAAGVDGHHPIPLLHRAVLDGHARDDDARVVDEDVEPAVAIGGEAHRVAPVGLVGDVEVDVDGVTTVGMDRRLDALALVVEDVTEHDPGALASERARFTRALSPGAPADQRDLSIQLSHAVLPLSVRRTRDHRASSSFAYHVGRS